jgi:hypothetical protein
VITGVDENPFITTVTGIRFHLLAPSPLEVDPLDIATALSRAPRFAGHTSEPWSVAQHCLLVAAILHHQGYNEKMQLAGLLHDAAEAYICDVPSPLKWAMDQQADPTYRRIEKLIEEAIDHALQPGWLGAPEFARAAIKRADLIALRTEAKAFIWSGGQWTTDGEEPFHQSPALALETYRIKMCLARGLTVMEQYLLTYDVLTEGAVR